MIRTTALAAAIAAALGWLGPAIDDHSAERDQADNLLATQRAAEQEAERIKRFEAGAQLACGPQSPWSLTAEGDVQCHTKRGKKTTTIPKGDLP